MSSNILFENIHKRFIAYESFLSTSNKLGLSNESIFAENHMSDLLKYVFGWKTINANEIKMNQEGYDLIDSKRKIFIQITANRSYRDKVKSTVSTFEKLNQDSENYNFYIVFVSLKVTKSLLGEKEANGLKYTVYSILELLEKIRNLPVGRLSKIDSLLVNMTSPLDLNISKIRKKVRSIPAQDIPEKRAGLYVRRDKLVEDLFDFSQKESGLLTGGPGYGKSIVMEELQRKYYSLNIPCFIIRINEIKTGKGQEIDRQLKCRNWLKSLKELKWEGNRKGMLIFDAFDTAKSDMLKDLMLQHIRASAELKPEWNILAGARAYDAENSNSLQELFPQKSISKTITCRNFVIPDLTVEERDLALDSANLRVAFQQCSAGLQQLLKIPYFLKLFEDIFTLEDGSVSNGLESEEDLLFAFWKKKVENEITYTVFLDKVTKAVIQSDGLVCDKLDFSGKKDSLIFKSLASQHVLCEVSMGREIAFFHNILAEYAVCRYILKIRIGGQMDLISESPSLVFHFRQSFIYFYERIWRTENEIFWEHYHRIRAAEQPIFKLLHHTILNYILINSYKEPHEILDHIRNSEEQYGYAVQKTLQSLRFNRKDCYEKHDAAFILEVCSSIEIIFLMELGRSIELLLQTARKENNPTIENMVGQAATAYMGFVLKEREGVDGSFIDHCGAVLGISNTVKAYRHNPEKSRSIINDTLNLLNKEGFNINYFYNLADDLPALAAVDIDYSLSIFRTLYYHEETSTERTNMGGSAVINLMSTRRQDYEMVRYALDTKFEEFLDLDFDGAAALGIDIANKYCSSEGYSWQVMPSKISISNFQTIIRYDKRNYNDTKENGPSSFALKIFNRLKKRLDSGEEQSRIESSLYAILKKGGASLIWRELLNFLTQSQKFNDIALEILLNKGIYECEETLHEAGELLRNTWTLVSKGHRKDIEQVIHNLTPVDGIHEKLNVLRVQRILGCLPKEDLVLEESIAVLSHHGTVENTPIVRESSVRIAEPYSHTQQEKMIYAGFDPETDLEDPVYILYKELEECNSRYENNKRVEELVKNYKKVFRTAGQLFKYSHSDSFRNDEIKGSCDFEISRCMRIISALEINFSVLEVRKLEETALFFIKSVAYMLPEYQSGTFGRRFFKGTETRGECVKALLNIFETEKSSGLLVVFDTLNYDNHPDVRYKALQSLHIIFAMDKTKYWKIVSERTAAESDGLCLMEIARTFKWIDVLEDDLEQAVRLTISLLHKMMKGQGTNREIYDESAVAALTIVRYFSYDSGLEIITEGLRIKGFIRQVIFIIRTTVNNYQEHVNFEELLEKGKVFFDILQFVLEHCFGELSRKGLTSPEVKDDLEVIDHIISNLYFIFIYSDEKKDGRRELSKNEKRSLYNMIIPILESVASQSLKIEQYGFMTSHTGYYFMLLLNKMLSFEPERILNLSASVIRSASKNNFSYDQTAFREIIRLTETIIADHKLILRKRNNLTHLLEILELFTASGFDKAVELTWRLKEAF